MTDEEIEASAFALNLRSMPDPGLTLTCPICGARLSYLLTLADTHIYRCGARDGLLELPPDRILRPTAREEVQTRIDRGDRIS